MYFITSKSEVLSKFKEFVNTSENKFGVQVKRLSIFNEANENVVKLRSDNGGEYTSHEFTNYCKERGISHEFTNPYTPEQNGVSERLNRTLIESARSMMYHAKLPLKFWAEAASTAAYLCNRSPTIAVNGMTPSARSKCGGRRRFHRLQLISRRLLRLRISYILIDFRVFRKTFNYASGFTHKCQA